MVSLVLVRVRDGQIERGHDAAFLAHLLNVTVTDLNWSVSLFGECYNHDYLVMADWRAKSYARREHMRETRH